jgi:putative DNA primase/helicase
MSTPRNLVVSDPFPFLPAILKDLPNWVAWKLVDDTKPPFIVGTNFKVRASSTDPSSWTDFVTAISKTAVSGTEGVGFVLGGPAIERELVGVDIDGCRNPRTGELAPWADKLVDLLDTYIEVTPSKTGIRAWVAGKWPFKEHVFNLDPAAGFGQKVKIEVYDNGRYFTVTGDSIFEGSVPIEKRDLADTYNLCLSIQAQYPPASKAKTESASGSTIEQGATIQRESGVITNKLELLMSGTVQSDKPFKIADGRGNSLEYASHSEADLALCTALALKHGNNLDLIWSDYLKSPLRREKWLNREDYFKENTIKKAIETAQAMASTRATSAKQLESSNNVKVGSVEEDEKIARIEARIDRTVSVRPVFPHWVLEGTSIYRNLAHPVAQTSGKHATMVFMPAFIGLMNYAAGKVSVQNENVILVQHLGMVSPAGDYHKSSSCAVAFDYLSKAELLTFSKLNPGGKIIQIQGGSSEGIGKVLFRANAKHAIVFYDELSKVCAKASIQNSALASDILTWAESGPFENTIKATSDTFSFAPNSYIYRRTMFR